MNQESKDILLRLLQQHKELGIFEQIDYQKFYLDSIISSSVALSDLGPEPIAPEMVDSYLEPHGGNKNRTYSKRFDFQTI